MICPKVAPLPKPESEGKITAKFNKYVLNAVPAGGNYTIVPTKDNDPLNGVSTFDLVLINKHILGLEPLNSPYNMIAADANNSRSITTFRHRGLRKLILVHETAKQQLLAFCGRCLPVPKQSNPFQEIFPETKSVSNLTGGLPDGDFVAVKVGDVNGNAVTNSLMNVDDRTEGTLLFDVTPTVSRREIKSGETFTLHFRASEKVAAYISSRYTCAWRYSISPPARKWV